MNSPFDPDLLGVGGHPGIWEASEVIGPRAWNLRIDGRRRHEGQRAKDALSRFERRLVETAHARRRFGERSLHIDPCGRRHSGCRAGSWPWARGQAGASSTPTAPTTTAAPACSGEQAGASTSAAAATAEATEAAEERIVGLRGD
jgi:hypothetical protein